MAITDDIKTLQQKAQSGDAEAQYEPGFILAMGERVPIDLKKAAEQFRLAANQAMMKKEANGKLAEEIENSQQPDQNTTQSIPPSC